MEAKALLDAHVQLKRVYTALNEALDLTRQMADAADRNDEVAAQLLVSMRQEPTDKLARAYQALDQQPCPRPTLPALRPFCRGRRRKRRRRPLWQTKWA